MRAIWNDKIIAEAGQTEVVEGNHYFPPESIKKEYFASSEHRSTCPWKGQAAYYDIVVDGERNKDAAWYYPQPKAEAAHIKNYVAFWRGVEIRDE
jgi:uncharacterized protein (DUF427 family)